MSLTALGTDISGVDDVDLFLSYAEPALAAAQAVARSLLHPQDALFWALDSGHDLTDHLHGFFDRERVQRAVQTQAEKDERVQSAAVDAQRLGDELKIFISLELNTDPSKVSFTLTIDQLGAALVSEVTIT